MDFAAFSDEAYALAFMQFLGFACIFMSDFGVSSYNLRLKFRLFVIALGHVSVWGSAAAFWVYSGISPLEILRFCIEERSFGSGFDTFMYWMSSSCTWVSLIWTVFAYGNIELERRDKKKLDSRRVHSAARDLIINTPPS